MIRTLILAALLALAQPALAASTCQFTVEQAIQQLTVNPDDIEPYAVIDEPDAVKATMETIRAARPDIPDLDVTRILLAVIVGKPYFGIEVGGCVSVPLAWPAGLAFPLPLPLKGVAA